MNQQPDKLFREKLAGYTKPAPSGAWDKIETRLGKKNNALAEGYGIWLKIAASITLVAIAAYLLWPNNPEAQSPIADKEQNIVKPNEKAVEQESNRDEDNIIKEEPAVTLAEEGKQKPQQPNKPIKKESKEVQPAPNNFKEQKQLVAQNEPNTVQQNNNDEAITSLPQTNEIIVAHTETNPKQESQNITLVFSADEVDEYLDKKALAKATSEDKKSSTFKKLLKKAADLKTNQDPFGDLRQKKNEILALNFKTNERGQNK